MGTKYYNSRGSNTRNAFVCKGEEGYIAMECTLDGVKLTEEEEMGNYTNYLRKPAIELYRETKQANLNHTKEMKKK